MRPRAIASKIASPVLESPRRPQPMSRTRWACGNMRRTSASSLVPGAPDKHLARKHQSDLLAGRRELLQRGERLARRAQAADAIVRYVPVVQFPLDLSQQVRVVIDGDQ